MSKYKKFTLRGLLAGAFIALFALVGGFVQSNQPLQATSARDCDTNAIINCGALTVDELMTKYSQNTTKDLPAIYSAFGINPTSLKTKAALGQVHNDGTVWLNGVKIADNAITAGRHYKAGSTQVPGTNVWARSPRVSFAATSIDAFIGFENGKPAWAILSACGNPVKWERPNVSVDKKVATQDLKSWVKDTTYTNNSEVAYLLTVKNTGNAADTNVTIIDRLPAYQTYVAGSTKINNAANKDGLTTVGLNLGTLSPGQVMYITFRTKLAVPSAKCGNTDMVNTVRQDSDKAGPHEDTATVHTNVTCIVVSCNALTASADAIKVGESVNYTATASASGTTISSYAFSVDGVVKQNTASNKFVFKPTAAAKHKIAVAVKFANGSVASGVGTACQKALTVNDIPQSVTCDALAGPSAVVLGASSTFTATASDTTLVQSYAFSVNNVVKANGASNVFTTTLPVGTHTIKAVVTPKAGVTDGGSTACVKTVTVTQDQMVKCDSLTGPATVKLGDSATFTANASDATLVEKYTFSVDGAAQAGTTNQLTITLPVGDHTISAVVTPKAGVTDGGSTACVKTVTVTDKPVIVTSCDALDASKSAIKLGETVTLTAKASAVNTTITGYTFYVDGKEAQALSAKNTFDFKPTAKGENTVSVKVTFANGDVKGGEGSCAKKITTTVDEPCVHNPNLPKDDVNCKPPVEIPNTGAGSIAGIFAGLTVAGAFVHNMLARRNARG